MSLRVRWIIIAVVFLLSTAWTLPNFFDFKGKWITNDKMTLGLDIQGGSHLVLRVDTDFVAKQEAQRMTSTMPKEMQTEGISGVSIEVTDPLISGLKLTFPDAATREKGVAWLEKIYGATFQITDSTDTVLQIRHPEVAIRQNKQRLVEQAIETIRNRIDEFGVAEPSITAQGTDRILVQLPGIKDASSAKDLINRTARLDFMMVSTEMSREQLMTLIKEAEEKGSLKLAEMKYSEYVDKLNEQLKGKLPANTVLLFEKDEAAATMEAGRLPYLLKTNETVGGDRLTNAFVSTGDFGRPVVAFRFDAQGAHEFAELTRKGQGKLMAIVLDKVVKSAPVIDEPITQGSGIIRLGGGPDPEKTFKEASVISMALRAGALPAPLEQLEERTVGPSLGADAIRQGGIACLIAAGLVFVFMFIYYSSFGIVADICLAFNVLIVLAVLSALNATLTLPGLAGLALTVGMAVDANVIIYERIKEEMGKGASPVAALREGYERAFSSIFDANLTTAIVCLVLMYYGSGPIRGFAVTLVSGLVASMFTSVFFTRTVFDFFVGRLKWNLAVKWG